MRLTIEGMFSLLRTRRWQAFTAAAVLAILLFGLLSLWQYHRAEEKRLEFAAIEARLNSDPMTLADDAGDPELEWQHVALTGRYDPDTQILIRNRPQDGSNGFWVASRLDTDTGSTWVVRGWIPVQGNLASQSVTPPDPPAGTVVVDGYARLPDPEPARRAEDIPAGQATALNTAELSELVGGPQPTNWYVIAARGPDLSPVLPPEPTDSRNLSYAGQWLLFAAIAIGGWFFFLRREAAEQAEATDQQTVAAPAETH